MKNISVKLEDPSSSSSKKDFLLYSQFSTATFFKTKKSGKKVKIGEISFYQCAFDISKDFSVKDNPRYSTDAVIAFENIEIDLKKGDVYINNLYVRKSKRGKGYGEYMVSWIEKLSSNTIFFNVPSGRTDFSGKNWKSIPEFYDNAFSIFELKERIMNTLLFVRN